MQKRYLQIIMPIVLIFVFGINLIYISSVNSRSVADSVTLSLTEVSQHKDSSMPCSVGCPPPPDLPHPVNDAPNCIYCGTFCCPASIAMMANFYSRGGIFEVQDYIYDNGKSTQGETKGNSSIETWGRGMFDGSGGSAPANTKEVQASFGWAISATYTEYDVLNPITYNDVILFIDNSHPILWLDHQSAGPSPNPWPGEMPWTLIEELETGNAYLIENNQGHAKVIVGYDKKGTPETTDDEFKYLDPWPTVTGIQITNWANISDPTDILIVDTDALFEFSISPWMVIFPVTAVIALVIIQKKFLR